MLTTQLIFTSVNRIAKVIPLGLVEIMNRIQSSDHHTHCRVDNATMQHGNPYYCSLMRCIYIIRPPDRIKENIVFFVCKTYK